MRNLKVQLALLVLLCAFCAMATRREAPYQLDLHSYSCIKRYGVQALAFRQHRFRLYTYIEGVPGTVALGEYAQRGDEVLLHDECTGKSIVYHRSGQQLIPAEPGFYGGQCRLEPLEYKGPLVDLPHSPELTSSPMTICGIRCGMTKDQVDQILGKPILKKRDRFWYQGDFEVRYNVENRVIGVRGYQAYQDGHPVITSDLEQLKQLFGPRLKAEPNKERMIDEEFGLTFYLVERENLTWTVDTAELGDMPLPGWDPYSKWHVCK